MAAKRSLWALAKAAWSALFAFVLPRNLWLRLVRRRFRKLETALKDEVTDSVLEGLLGLMGRALRWWPAYGKNIVGWKGTLVFCTTDRRVAFSTVFSGSGMRVLGDEAPDYQAKVVFRDGAALRAFLRSAEHDIFDSLLANNVFVWGNLNYVYKFGFLVKDLGFRLKNL